MSVSQLEALYSEAVAALDAGDYALAVKKALAVKVRLATTPNVLRSLGGGGQQHLVWANQQALDRFIAECKALSAADTVGSAGLQMMKLKYARPDGGDDFC